METKVCKTCGNEKPLSEFHKAQEGAKGVMAHCKECKNWAVRSDKSKQQEIERWELYNKGLKRCPQCNEIKSHNEFAIARGRWDGFRAYCKECEQKINLERSRTPEFREVQAEYMSTSGYYEKLKIRYRKKMDTIPEYKLERYLRNNIYNGITGNGYVKMNDFITMVGMPPVQFKNYLESLFQEGMSWGNYERKGWHVDHIIPMHAFNKRDPIQQLACSFYKNLQPMWGRPNIQKGAKYKIEDFEAYMKWFIENVINKK